MADLDDLAGRLGLIAEELADAAIEALRDALEDGEPKSELERRLTRARRAVERAAAILQGDGDAAD